MQFLQFSNGKKERIYSRMPKGFHIAEGASNPSGYVWIRKGSMFFGKHERALIKNDKYSDIERRAFNKKFGRSVHKSK